MLWLSTALIVGFGALTICFAAIRSASRSSRRSSTCLLRRRCCWSAGWRGKALLQDACSRPRSRACSDEGWLKLSRNWGAVLPVPRRAQRGAALHAQLRATGSRPSCGCSCRCRFLFTFTQMPMLLRHGLAAEERGRSRRPTPPPTELTRACRSGPPLGGRPRAFNGNELRQGNCTWPSSSAICTSCWRSGWCSRSR